MESQTKMLFYEKDDMNRDALFAPLGFSSVVGLLHPEHFSLICLCSSTQKNSALDFFDIYIFLFLVEHENAQ